MNRPAAAPAHGRAARAPRPAHERAPLHVASRGRPWLRRSTLLATVLGVALLFGLVAGNALLVRNQSRIDDLDQRIDEATRVNRQLRFEVAELESPDRIRQIAIGSGMIVAEDITFLPPISQTELSDLVAPGDVSEGADEAEPADPAS